MHVPPPALLRLGERNRPAGLSQFSSQSAKPPTQIQISLSEKKKKKRLQEGGKRAQEEAGLSGGNLNPTDQEGLSWPQFGACGKGIVVNVVLPERTSV